MKEAKKLVRVDDLLDRALGTRVYFQIKSIVVGLPHVMVMDEWIHVDDLVQKAKETDAFTTVRDIVEELPKFDLPDIKDPQMGQAETPEEGEELEP